MPQALWRRLRRSFYLPVKLYVFALVATGSVGVDLRASEEPIVHARA